MIIAFAAYFYLLAFWEQLERRKQEDELKQVMQQEQHLERVKVYFLIVTAITIVVRAHQFYILREVIVTDFYAPKEQNLTLSSHK